MRRSAISLAVALACALPLSASAVSIEELQAQIGALLSQVTALQTQIATLSGGSSTTPAAAAPSTNVTNAAVCPLFSRNLLRGSQGSDVLSLQIMLGNDAGANYTAGPTGFFGPATEAALQRWQAEHGIATSGDAKTTGFGALGPKSRAAMQSLCVAAAQIVVPQTIAPAVSPLSCPRIDIPTSCSGTLLDRGTDSNGCALGYSCRTATFGTNPPVISNLTGPSIASMNATTSWKIEASVPNFPSVPLTYSVQWGDEASTTSGATPLPPSATTSTTTILMHAYKFGGTYYPVFSVTTNGASATISSSIMIASSTTIISSSH